MYYWEDPEKIKVEKELDAAVYAAEQAMLYEIHGNPEDPADWTDAEISVWETIGHHGKGMNIVHKSKVPKEQVESILRIFQIRRVVGYRIIDSKESDKFENRIYYQIHHKEQDIS